VAYGTLAADERRALHAAAVDAIERAYADRLDERRDQLAHHVARGEVWSKAMSYFRASLDISVEDVSAVWRAGDHAHAVARSYDDLRVAQEFKNLVFQMEIQLRLGRAHHSLGDYRKAIELLRRNTDEVGDEIPETSPARVAALLSWVWLALAHAEVGERADAQRCATQALAAAETIGDAYARAAAPWAAGVVALLEGAVDGALSWLSLARDASRSRGAGDLAPAIAAALGFAQALAGRHEEAAVTLAAAVADAEAKGVHADHALRLAWWAEAERLAGRVGEAEALAMRAMETARRHGERGHLAWALHARANVAAARGEAGAAALAEDARALAERLGMRALLAREAV
jgi:tetratricopeptide (TPR) repeat protein